ncbi:MAG TPA: leucine-rich repeat domain-containing protein, partial [Bacteroidales bacterium]|nr:leucine-rich repeat domain-containing protein [Bacteroidales bacterium]
YSHILRLERIEEIAVSFDLSDDIDYSPVYEWDFETEGFHIIYDNAPSGPFRIKTRTRKRSCNFFDALKIREYGDTDIELPSNYLTDTEELELSSWAINDLDGVQFCINATVIDLSNNRITDLSPLAGLSLIEELDLSDNRISDIDTLSNLLNLKNLMLANNSVKDISPLLDLDKLEYVDFSGNKISDDQIILLKERNIYVEF